MTDERDWIRRACQGEVEAWEALVAAHQQPVFRLAYLLLGDPDDAEDTAQETFIRAYRALPGFDLDRPLRPWLLRITANLAYNWRRSAWRYFNALQRLLLSRPVDLSTRQLAEQNLEEHGLWLAVRRLTPADQQVIYLRYFLECSESEMAQVLGVAAGTVKSRLHRALARLRTVLEEENVTGIEEGKDAT